MLKILPPSAALPARKNPLPCVVLFCLLAVTALAAGKRTLPDRVPDVVARLGLQPVGRLPATNRLNLAIGLPLRNREALTNLLGQLYNPASTNFHRYLSPDQFVEQFAPTETDYQTVLQFARSNGLAVVTTYSHRELVEVSATVADLERTFQVRLNTYQHPTQGRQFYAPDAAPTVDAGVPIQSVSGLNSYDRNPPGVRRQTKPGESGPANGTGPGGTTYRGKDFRNAYAPGVTLDGSGQNVGLVELDGYYQSDITTYESQAKLADVPLIIVPLHGSSGFPDTNGGYILEVSLDMEMAISMAPGMNALYIFEGDNFDTILGSMVTHTNIKQFSSSWFGFGFDSTGDGFLQQLAAQGQSFLQCSGDGDAYTQPIIGPADDNFVTSVGGTALTMDSSASNYVSEKVWNSGRESPAWFGNGGVSGGAGYWGSGGGVSSTYNIPGWQQGVNMAALGGSTTMRNIPDVALTAVSIWANYNNGQAGGVEGTSCAAPLWAGFIALVNQQAAADGKPPVGFLNPVLYAIGEGPNYNADFNDITNSNDYWPGSTNKYAAVPGYDLATGWGTPNGQNMINALAGYAGPIYVDFNYTGSTVNGSYNNPYKTLAAGTNAVTAGGTIIIRTAGSSSETMTISKAMTITSLGGTAIIGN